MIARRLGQLLIAASAGLWANAAWAGCYDPGACTCTMSLTNVAFGNYDPQSPSPKDTAGTLTISCTSGDPGNSTFSVALSPGSSGNANARTMMRGTHPLYYNLYSNVARTAIWGDDSGGGQSVASGFPPAGRTAKAFTIYGRIPALQNAWSGSYNDSITVTVSY